MVLKVYCVIDNCLGYPKIIEFSKNLKSKSTKVVFGREFPQKNVAECLFRHILQDTIFL